MTYAEIAENFELWSEFVDPSSTMTEDEFNEMSASDRLELMASMFGDEVTA